jgi:arabinose-5-phosphate isomerase
VRERSEETAREVLESGRAVVRAEARVLAAVADRLDDRFAEAVALVASGSGRTVTTGVGKAGIVARKAAATLASTGAAAFFLHPCEALHGDLGMVREGDVVVAFSKSGEADELVRVLGPLRAAGARIIGVTCTGDSSLARRSDVVLDLGPIEEAGALGLAPSTSTTAMLAVADALALAAMRQSGFGRSDYARLHPGGALGRRLLRVEEIMRRGEELPTVTPEVSVREMLMHRADMRGLHRPPGAAVVTDAEGRLVGIFTDGDLRRHLGEGGDFLERPVAEVMTARPRSARAGSLAAEVAAVMKEREIDELPIVDDEDRVVGLVDVQDLLAAGFVVAAVDEGGAE